MHACMHACLGNRHFHVCPLRNAPTLSGCVSGTLRLAAVFLRLQAKKFLAERSPAYMTARSALKEMQGMTSNLHRPPLPRVPVWAQSAAALLQAPSANAALAARERGYADAWKLYLQWEESNPLELEDLQTLHSRVLMAYRKATMHMRFYPEIWCVGD